MNIYALNNPASNTELFHTLYQNKNIRIEAIRSHLTHPGEIYNQKEDEWVLLIRGYAKLLVGERVIELEEGEAIYLPKFTPHQVLSTSEDALWLGVFNS
ncbi:MAG: cupin domain-containing protein [Sulfuricurvum sp.]|nr:cupin domain-containing protein [Sulfuricurvum sp.]